MMRSFLGISVLIIGVLSGCGSGKAKPATAAVRGVVTWNGLPVQEGVILFMQGGSNKTAATNIIPAQIIRGEYSLEAKFGPVIGTNRIEIRANKKTGETKEVLDIPADGRLTTATTRTADVLKQYIPRQYNEDSTLTHDIKSGVNQIDLKLTGEEAARSTFSATPAGLRERAR